MRLGKLTLLSTFFLLGTFAIASDAHSSNESSRSFIEVEEGPDSVLWIVQLSDLHFSVFHPSRASDFRQLVSPALSTIKPSLVLITGDLTDGKSKDLLTMKQNELEWIEYQEVLSDVIKNSGLDEKIFYDLRGNHDNFGVPEIGGKFDFYHKYSINRRLGRRGNVHSVTLHQNGRKYLFVGFDSTMEVGLRGPTNLFGHPTDHLLKTVDIELSQFDFDSSVTKIAFGHFPLSFSAVSETGKSLKKVFLKNHLSAYLCGHLHARFGKNLKRLHCSGSHFLDDYYQRSICRDSRERNVSFESEPAEEFWEWEMGDWRRRRKMRILAVDSGHVSFVDIDLLSAYVKTFILPTYPVDSRFMQTSSNSRDQVAHELVRALVFSAFKIQSVYLKIYDSNPGYFSPVLDSEMILQNKDNNNRSGGVLYTSQWNRDAFSDPSPTRYWLQIEAIDFSGVSTLSEMRPFSVNGLTASFQWTWKEFFVMGLQWEALYRPLLSLILFSIFSLLLFPQALLLCFKDRYTYTHVIRRFRERKLGVCILDGCIWVLLELCRERIIWFGILLHLLHLSFLPWFSGHVFTDPGQIGYMTHKGWDISGSILSIKKGHIGSPDVMVIVLPHLFFVILPSILLMAALSAERSSYHAYHISSSCKKFDDYDEREGRRDSSISKWKRFFWDGRIIRKFLLLLCLAVLWGHWKRCRSLVKAYEMNMLVHSSMYCFTIPMFLAGASYKTA